MVCSEHETVVVNMPHGQMDASASQSPAKYFCSVGLRAKATPSLKPFYRWEKTTITAIADA